MKCLSVLGQHTEPLVPKMQLPLHKGIIKVFIIIIIMIIIMVWMWLWKVVCLYLSALW